MPMSNEAGVSAVLTALGASKFFWPPRANRGLRRCAEIVLARALELVPVDTRRLYDSGRIEEGPADGLFGALGGKRYTVTFGGEQFDVDYAVYVHEDLTKHHPHGQAQYLLRAVYDTAAECRGALKAGMGSDL